MQEMMWVVLCFLSATIACAESAKDAVNTFQDSIGTNQLVLRNFSGEDKVHARWTGPRLSSILRAGGQWEFSQLIQ